MRHVLSDEYNIIIIITYFSVFCLRFNIFCIFLGVSGNISYLISLHFYCRLLKDKEHQLKWVLEWLVSALFLSVYVVLQTRWLMNNKINYVHVYMCVPTLHNWKLKLKNAFPQKNLWTIYTLDSKWQSQQIITLCTLSESSFQPDREKHILSIVLFRFVKNMRGYKERKRSGVYNKSQIQQ